MEKSFENEIYQEFKEEKLINFFKKYKIIIISIFLIFIVLIFIYQFNIFYIKKRNIENVEKILLSQIYLDNQNLIGLNILNDLSKSENNSISILSSKKLIDFYLKENKKDEALKKIIFLKKKLKKDTVNLELLNIKEAVIKFDDIKEEELLKILKTKENETFTNTKKKLLYDFYIKNNEIKKAKQFLVN